MTILEIHYDNGTVDTLKFAGIDPLAAAHIGQNIRHAINTANEVKCNFIKSYTEEYAL